MAALTHSSEPSRTKAALPFSAALQRPTRDLKTGGDGEISSPVFKFKGQRPLTTRAEFAFRPLLEFQATPKRSHCALRQ